MHHVGGGDRTVPFHVPYSEPKPKPTGLDWGSMTPEPTTPAEVAVARPRCNHCREHVDVVSVHTGLCPSCEVELDPHNQEAPTAQEATMPEPTAPEIPEYIRGLTDLLIATEGHRDPLVRATRKIVVQAALALDQAQAASPAACRECGCTDNDACFPSCFWVEPDLCSACATPQSSGSDATATAHTPSATGSTSSSEPEPRTNGTGAKNAAARITALGTTPAEIRSWAFRNGVECTSKGVVPSRVVDAWEAARSGSAA